MPRSAKRKLADDAQIALRLEFAARQAINSQIVKHKTGAVIANVNGDPISHGWSHYGERTLAIYKQYRSVHAELHAIIRAPRRDDLVGGTIYIATVRARTNTIGLAKPCMLCENLLYEVGISRVIFTTNAGKWEEFNLTRPRKSATMRGGK